LKWPVLVRTVDGEAEWTLSPSRNGRDWSLSLASPDRTWTATGPDCFMALRNLPAEIGRPKRSPLCFGGSLSFESQTLSKQFLHL